jgi:hypothetical protein
MQLNFEGNCNKLCCFVSLLPLWVYYHENVAQIEFFCSCLPEVCVCVCVCVCIKVTATTAS